MRRLISTFKAIKTRCNYPKAVDYKYYGGRGIKCLWKSFEEFRDDMQESYEAHVKEFGERDTTIERRENNGNYCKKNCRWATMEEQSRNKRNSYRLSYNGQTKSIPEWAKECGVSCATLRNRIRAGWEVEDILSKTRSSKKMARVFVEFKGQTKSLKDWSRYLDINYNTLRDRIKYLKWPLEKAFTK